MTTANPPRTLPGSRRKVTSSRFGPSSPARASHRAASLRFAPGCVEGELMPSAEEMRETLSLYLRHVAEQDLDAVLGLFAEEICVEDPVGGAAGTQVEGREAVREFFRRGFSRTRPVPTLTGPIRTTHGNQAAMPFTLRLELGGRSHEIDVIDVVAFDASGKITRLRAFWNPDEIRALN